MLGGWPGIYVDSIEVPLTTLVRPHAGADEDTLPQKVPVCCVADLGNGPATIRALNEGKGRCRIPAAIRLLGRFDLRGRGGLFRAFLDRG